MNLEYFEESLECLMHCGLKLSPEQRHLIENSLIVLKTENRFVNMYFWGRLDGVLKDYYIAFGYMRDVLKDRKFFYSLDGFEWRMLPFVFEPRVFQATLSCREPFIGDPHIVTTVPLAPKFVDDMGLSGPLERFRLKEEDRLAAIVFMISEESAVCPRGAFYKLADGRIVVNELFRGVHAQQVSNPAFYQLYRLPRHSPCTNMMSRCDYDSAVDFLDFIVDAVPENRGFSLNLQRNERIVIIKSCSWMGMTFFHKVNSHKHGFCYFGNGKKNYDIFFML